jgi:hypothetical protein
VREKAKLIIFAALSAALTVAGLSLAAGGASDSGSNGSKNARQSHRDFGPPGMAIDSDVADVMRQIHEAVEQKVPEIADPIIKKAEDAGNITSAQADQLRSLVQARADGKRPSGDPRALFSDADVRAVLNDIFKAEAAQAPGIAEPIIQKALDENKITNAQAGDIRSRLKNPPRFGRGPGFGPRGPGLGPRHGGPPGFGRGSFDQDVATVLRDIHRAVEKKAPEIADPIIQKAEDAGDITSAQADKLRAAAQAIADGKRPGADTHALLSDADVRKVVQDTFAAAAKQAPQIADPIIQKAVDEKKITSAQAGDIRKKLENLKSFRGGPPPFGGPGGHRGPPWEGRGRFERPHGVAPGFLPGGTAPGARPAVQDRPAAQPAFL